MELVVEETVADGLRYCIKHELKLAVNPVDMNYPRTEKQLQYF